MLTKMPNGTVCFIDANIFYYHLVETPLLSEPCSDFLERVSRNEIIGYTSTVAIAKAIHKVMLAEAVAGFHLERRGLAHRLQRRSEFISQLSEHKKVVPCIIATGIIVETVTIGVLSSAGDISIQYKLLTNDSIALALIQKLNITHLATNDDNFDDIDWLTVWTPRETRRR